MNVSEPSASEEPSANEESEVEELEETPTEITDPDDIDALLESMGTDEPQKESAASESHDEATESLDDEESNDIVEDEHESPNKAKIESLSEEYVAPLLAVDFSDIHSDSSSDETHSNTEKAEDDLDALIAEAEEPEQKETADILDIGDELEGTEQGAFDEETLAKLLNESEAENAVELTPDFSDQNVLADLLTDNGDDADSAVSEATEIEDIQELDNLEFDELLANIEEESNVANTTVDYNQQTDFDSPISLDDFDDPNSGVVTPSDVKDTEENFVSVDSLLSASQEVEPSDEVYNEANIDVGLNDYPEFTEDVNQVDVDDDENGMAAKLDLAKVYVEISDQDNAQVLLQEVISQGNPQQQLEAQELLDKL